MQDFATIDRTELTQEVLVLTKEFDFENALKSLEIIIDDMDNQTLPLDQALKQFETGVKLIKQCQQTLQAAEQKIQSITQEQMS